MVRDKFTAYFLGSSLTTGRLSGDWVPELVRQLQTYPEAKGPIELFNGGKGSQTTVWGLTQIPQIISLQPRVVVIDPFSTNDCVDFGGGPAVSLSDHTTNLTTMITQLKAGIPGVLIVILTMSPVSTAVAAIRPNLANYYAADVIVAAAQSCQCVDVYPTWPHPLPDGGSYGSTPSFSGWGGTWNPADKDADIALSGSNLIATNTGGGADKGVRGTASFSTGLRNYSATIGVANDMTVGIGIGALSVAQKLGTGAGGYGLDSAGNLFTGSATPSDFLGASIAGDIIGVCVNFTALKIWWSRNGFWLNGDPEQNLGGRTINANTYFPFACMDSAGAETGLFTAYPGDGLHPLASLVNTYLLPPVVTALRALMAAFWP